MPVDDFLVESLQCLLCNKTNRFTAICVILQEDLARGFLISRMFTLRLALHWQKFPFSSRLLSVCVALVCIFYGLIKMNVSACTNKTQ